MITHEQQRTEQREVWGAAATKWDAWDGWLERQTRALTERMCERAGLAPGMQALDVACGVGQPALTVAAKVAPGGRVIATDVAPAMLEITGRKARERRISNLEVREMGAEDLAFPDASFDAVTCRFGLMFCPDPVRAASEIRRVLRPGARAVLAVWDDPARNAFFTIVLRALAERKLVPPPDPTAPGVFRLAPPGELERVLRAAGFSEPTVEAMPLRFEVASPGEYWTVQTELVAPLRAALARLTPEKTRELRAAVIASAALHLEMGRVRLSATPLVATVRG